MTPLSELIRVMRKKALLSQEDFAKALNVSVGTINRWENAKTKPNITAMKKIKAFCEENKPKVAVLCVPRDGAQQVSGRLVDLGIEGFWNFSHYDLSVSYPNVVVENVHLGDSLMSLGYRLRNQE